MRKHKYRLLTLIAVACAALLNASPIHAETIEAVFRKGSDNYTFTIDSDRMLDLNNPDLGKTYESAIVFHNDTDAHMKVTLVSVEELTKDTDVYKRSCEHIYDDTQDYSNGLIKDSKFETTLKPGETRTVHFDYMLDPEHARKPDNALMGQHMECRFTFVGEYDVPPAKDGAAGESAVNNTVGHVSVSAMLDTDAGMLTVAAGAVCAAAGVALILISKRRKRNAG